MAFALMNGHEQEQLRYRTILPGNEEAAGECRYKGGAPFDQYPGSGGQASEIESF